MANFNHNVAEMNNRRRIILLASTTVGLLLLVFWWAPVDKTLATIGLLRGRTLLLVLIISALTNIGLYGERWHRTLKYVGISAPFSYLMRLNAGTGPVRLLLPIQTGEIITAAILGRRLGKPISTIVSTLFYNKYLSFAATLLLALGGMIAGALATMHSAWVIASFAGGVTILFFLLESKRVRQWILRLGEKIHPGLAQLSARLLSTHARLTRGAKMLLLAYAFVFAILEVITVWLIARDLGIGVSFIQLIVIVQLMVLVTNLPITMAGVGSREALSLVLLARFATPEQAAAFGVLYSAVEYLWPLVAGLPFTSSVIVDAWRDFRRGKISLNDEEPAANGG